MVSRLIELSGFDEGFGEAPKVGLETQEGRKVNVRDQIKFVASANRPLNKPSPQSQ